jgi:hypothetical protein
LLVVFALLIILLWVPWLVGRKRERAAMESSNSTLVANLDRVINFESSLTSGAPPDPEPRRSLDTILADVSEAYEKDQNGPSDLPPRSLTPSEPEHETDPEQIVTSSETAIGTDQLKQRVTEMRRVMSSGSGSAQATAQWLQLLKEINDWHNAGELSTETFSELNTQLLSVIEQPTDD